MHVLITGGTGYIGSRLSANLEADITILSRFDKCRKYRLINNLDKTKYDVIINLAGAPINCRWTERNRQRIYASRVDTTNNIIEHCKNYPPQQLISCSAIGYYGNCPYQVDEKYITKPEEFAQHLCHAWEASAHAATLLGIKTTILRMGVVIGKNSAIMRQLLPSFKLGLGSIVATGKQLMSWVDIQDVIAITNFILQNELTGTYNITSPNPVSNYEFSKTLANVLHRPCFLKIPEFVIKSMFGKMGEELLLTSQNIIPSNIINAGYKFKVPEIKQAIINSCY